jgi:hypothetical protein
MGGHGFFTLNLGQWRGEPAREKAKQGGRGDGGTLQKDASTRTLATLHSLPIPPPMSQQVFLNLEVT